MCAWQLLKLLEKQRRTFWTRQSVKHVCHLLDACDACAGVRVHVCVLTLNQRCDDNLDLCILSATVLTKKVFILFSSNPFVYFTAYIIQELRRLEKELCKPKEMNETLQQNVRLPSGDSGSALCKDNEGNILQNSCTVKAAMYSISGKH